jgi:hypothetical protein
MIYGCTALQVMSGHGFSALTIWDSMGQKELHPSTTILVADMVNTCIYTPRSTVYTYWLGQDTFESHMVINF